MGRNGSEVNSVSSFGRRSEKLIALYIFAKFVARRLIADPVSLMCTYCRNQTRCSTKATVIYFRPLRGKSRLAVE